MVDDRALDDLVALLPPLLETLERLGFVARHLNPPDFAGLMEAVGSPDEPLRSARARLASWPDALAHVRSMLEVASDAAVAAFDGLRAANAQNDLWAVHGALRYLPRAQEALYPLASRLPPVSRFFMDPAVRGDADLEARIARSEPRGDTGIMHVGNEPGSRGGFSMYVPEYYTPDTAWPLVVALHGGAGNGRGFLWSWLSDARSHGAILLSPTATGRTWALAGPDTDTPNLMRILDRVRTGWNIDAERLLLTGMSDGGTFTYVSGLEPSSPFTHLAPVAAAFHPMLAQMADPQRIRGLPIHLAHGVLDWMFPIEVARQARQALEAAGAALTYREIDDLSHTYPRELNPVILDWLRTT